MAEVQHHLDIAAPASAALADLTRGYVNLRRSYAEAATRATTETELGKWQERTSRMRRYWASINQEELSEVLDAIAAVHAEQQVINTHIAAQLARAHPETVRNSRLG